MVNHHSLSFFSRMAIKEAFCTFAAKGFNYLLIGDQILT